MLFVKSLTSIVLLVALCLSPFSLFTLGGCDRDSWRTLPISIPKHKGKVEDEESLCETGAKPGKGVLARPYRWHRCVCLFHGCVVNDEWLPLCQKACCHIPVNEAASYSLVVMGLTPGSRQGAGFRQVIRQQWKWKLKVAFPMPTTRFPPSMILFLKIVMHKLTFIVLFCLYHYMLMHTKPINAANAC